MLVLLVVEVVSLGKWGHQREEQVAGRPLNARVRPEQSSLRGWTAGSCISIISGRWQRSAGGALALQLQLPLRLGPARLIGWDFEILLSPSSSIHGPRQCYLNSLV